MKTHMFKAGDWVTWQSLCGPRMFVGQIIGFYGKGVMAMCTDQSGLSPRPVGVRRLHPHAPVYWHTESAA